MPSTTNDHDLCVSSLNYCQKLGEQFLASNVTFIEFADNMTITVIDAPEDCMGECFAFIPSSILMEYISYLRSLLEPVDFMPSPIPFVARLDSQEEANEVKHRLRPKYIRLYQSINEFAYSRKYL